MYHNRISHLYPNSPNYDEPQQPVVPTGFIAIPSAHLPAVAQPLVERSQQLYQMAYAQAQAAAASRADSDCFEK